MKIGLVGPSYQEFSLPFDAQRSVNLYPVMDKSGKEVAAMYGTPGLKLFTNVGVGPIRGSFCAANGRAFVVSGARLYEVNGAGLSTDRGGLDFTTGTVMMEENGFQLAICDGLSLYIFTYATNAFQKIVTANLPSAASVTFLDGYFIVNEVNSGRFHISGLYNGLSWGALDFATAESSPDDLLRVLQGVGQLWLFGAKTTEIYTNSGRSAFPFERISGAKMETGIVAPNTALALDNSVFWLGRDAYGSGIVYRARGFSPQRISTNAIEIILQSATFPEKINAYTYQQDGRVFYILTGGGLPTSLVYDLSTQMWHERAYLNEQGDFEQHLGSTIMFAFNKHIVGDRRDGVLYELDDMTYSDNGEPICRERTYTHLCDEFTRQRYNRLVIGLETGVGLQAGQGENPLVSLQLSKDGARTWSDWHTKTFGRVGKYETNVVYRRLGIAQQMTFKIRITDPVKVAICGSYLA